MHPTNQDEPAKALVANESNRHLHLTEQYWDLSWLGRGTMERAFGDFLNTRHCDAIALLDCEGVIRWLQSNQRTLAKGHSDQLCPQGEGAWRTRQRALHPGEIGRLRFSTFRVPEITCSREVLLAQRNPCEPNERLQRSLNGQKQAAKYEKVLPIDDALIAGQERPS